MAMQVLPTFIGVDVSKQDLMISLNGEAPSLIGNQLSEIKTWLKAFKMAVDIALEATGDYHLLLAEQAHRLGHRVYLVNGYRLSRYRDSVGQRAKTDQSDACLLARYLKREREDLRRWEPPCRQQQQLQRLLHRRATLVQAKVAIQQSLGGMAALKVTLRALTRQITRTDLVIQKQIRHLIQTAHWNADLDRCQRIEGIGPITAAALTCAFHRGQFKTSDAFVAFLGLDVRVRDSGRKRGKRCLTKQGNKELRRLLFLAAMQAKSKPAWQAYYQRFISRGLAPIQALNVLARKLARVAYALMKNQADYQPKIA